MREVSGHYENVEGHNERSQSWVEVNFIVCYLSSSFRQGLAYSKSGGEKVVCLVLDSHPQGLAYSKSSGEKR